MKLNQVLAARDTLNKLSKKHYTKFRVVHDIAALLRAVAVELEFFDAEFKKLIDLYSEKDENGKPVILANGNIKLRDAEAKKAFDAGYEDLMHVEFDISKIVIVEEDFASPEDYPTPEEMNLLEPFVDFGMVDNVKPTEA